MPAAKEDDLSYRSVRHFCKDFRSSGEHMEGVRICSIALVSKFAQANPPLLGKLKNFHDDDEGNDWLSGNKPGYFSVCSRTSASLTGLQRRIRRGKDLFGCASADLVKSPFVARVR